MITARLHRTVGQWPGPGHSNALYSWLIPPDLLSRFELQIDQRALRSEIFGFALVSVLVCDNLWFIPSPGSHGSLTCTKWFKFNCRHTDLQRLVAPPQPQAPASRRRWRRRGCCCRWLWRWRFRFGLNWRQEWRGERISGEHAGHLPARRVISQQECHVCICSPGYYKIAI